MGSYQDVSVEAVDRNARTVTLRVTEIHPDMACIGALWMPDGTPQHDVDVGLLALFAAQILIDRERALGGRFLDAVSDDALAGDLERASAVVHTVGRLGTPGCGPGADRAPVDGGGGRGPS